MTAREDQPQAVVFDAVVILRGRITGVGIPPRGDLAERRIEAGTPAHGVNRLEAAGRHEPCSGIGWHSVGRPPLDRRRERIVHRLLGEIEVAEETDQRGEDASRVGSIDGLDGGCYVFISQIGRTSMLPQRAPGIFDATWIASLRSRASMR